MEKNENDSRPDEREIRSKVFDDEATHEKIQRHLSDITDTITEDDIKNVKTDIGLENIIDEGGEEKGIIEGEAYHKDQELSEEEKKHEYAEGKKITSTWNILSE